MAQPLLAHACLEKWPETGNLSFWSNDSQACCESARQILGDSEMPRSFPSLNGTMRSQRLLQGWQRDIFKVAEHNFQEPMFDSLARVKINYRGMYSPILTSVRAVVMATGLVKNKALIMVFVYLKKYSVVRLFSSFAHYKLTLNSFCQHCSNKIWRRRFP